MPDATVPVPERSGMGIHARPTTLLKKSDRFILGQKKGLIAMKDEGSGP
jgi:hypothetical protein